MKHFRVEQCEPREDAGGGGVCAPSRKLRVTIKTTPPVIAGEREEEETTRGLGLEPMAADIGRYWFVAAVFRDPKDLAETIAQMRAGGLTGRVCVLANHAAEAARSAVAGSGDRVSVVTFDGDGAMDLGGIDGEPAAMRALLQSMDGKADGDGEADGHVASRPHIYAQLHEDIREGALVLMASVAGPDEQVVGARLLLKGNCECVLTHEINASAAS